MDREEFRKKLEDLGFELEGDDKATFYFEDSNDNSSIVFFGTIRMIMYYPAVTSGDSITTKTFSTNISPIDKEYDTYKIQEMYDYIIGRK